MAKNKKPLLKEGTIRRMMKLADMEALGNGFISEKYTPLEEEEIEEKKQPYGGNKGDAARSKPDYMQEQDELEATEDELGAEDEFADEEGGEIADLEADADVDAGVGEVTITDEEAQDIIDLADKLKGAVGEEPEGDIEIEAEEEIDLEEPISDDTLDLDEENVDEDALYEAALKGLQIDLINDKKEQKQARLQEAKKRIYKRVVKRLLEKNKKK
jgi:hypothetical protein